MNQSSAVCSATPSAPALPAARCAELTDAWDIWLEATGLLHDTECRQDAEEAAELGQAAAQYACSWVPRHRL